MSGKTRIRVAFGPQELRLPIGPDEHYLVEVYCTVHGVIEVHAVEECDAPGFRIPLIGCTCGSPTRIRALWRPPLQSSTS